MKKRWLKIVGAVAAVFVLLLLLIPLFVNGETFRPTVESKLSAALNRKVALGHLSFSLFSGSLVANDISISDDPAFSPSPFVKAKDIKIGVEVGALIFSRQVHVTGITLDEPSIQLIQNQAGKWNFSSIGGASSPKSASPPGGSSPVSGITISKLKINDGTATLSSIPATAKPFVYSGVDLSAKNVSVASSSPFDLSANLPGSGKLKLSGTVGPLAQADASETPFRANLSVSHLDPVAAGIVERDKGISTIADIDAQLNSNGRNLSTTGKIKADKLQLSRTGSPAPEPVNVDFNLASDLRARSGRANDIALHLGSATAHLTGSFRSTTQAPILDLRLNAPGLSVDQLQKFLPAFGVQVPSGSQLKGGTLTANIAVTGPASAATISGPVSIDNTTLAGFDLGSKIQGLSNAGGTSGGTQIQQVKASVDSNPSGTQISNIYGNLPQLGTATGSGSVSPAGALNFHMVATFNNNNVVGNLANTAMNTAASQASGFLGGLLGKGGSKPAPSKSNAARGIPLIITGTATSPSIRADVGSIAKGFLK
ncbi:AsmA family protein [Occallatibacter riparius]|uniref:AsmA family protein n=1 Tax=Occallatibacter riparius TaxID=1002689 RepID=A0A9J7BLY1_9BACT|nr:AsmA family protein [Occallatibacter riparius]UWZ83667.1 AsmA family protein [Occallatibacter riparius]